jgi:4'-phosphopantetheinyl transferase EntD
MSPALSGSGAIYSPDALFPTQLFGFGRTDTPVAESWLHPLERELICNAVPKRRGEFAAGRYCARLALRRLGVSVAPILRQESGCPKWPDGIVGSISHTNGCVIAVAARDCRVVSVGIDVECHDRPFPHQVLSRIGTSVEIAALQRFQSTQFGVHAYALFSAKEAVYKCVHSATGQRLTFHDVEIELNLTAGVFRAVPRGTGTPSVLIGRVGCSWQHVFTAVWWEC